MRDGPCLLLSPWLHAGVKTPLELSQRTPARSVPPSGCPCSAQAGGASARRATGPSPPACPLSDHLCHIWWHWGGRRCGWCQHRLAGERRGLCWSPPAPCSWAWCTRRGGDAGAGEPRGQPAAVHGVGSWSRSCGDETWCLGMSALSQAWSSNPLTQISARFLQKKEFGSDPEARGMRLLLSLPLPRASAQLSAGTPWDGWARGCRQGCRVAKGSPAARAPPGRSAFVPVVSLSGRCSGQSRSLRHG